MSEAIPKGQFGYIHLDLKSSSGEDEECSSVQAWPMPCHLADSPYLVIKTPPMKFPYVFKFLYSSLHGWCS